MFSKNIDTQGRILRAALGVGLLLYAFFAHSWLALGFALFTFYEALASWCIVYQLLGKNSCPNKPK